MPQFNLFDSHIWDFSFRVGFLSLAFWYVFMPSFQWPREAEIQDLTTTKLRNNKQQHNKKMLAYAIILHPKSSKISHVLKSLITIWRWWEGLWMTHTVWFYLHVCWMISSLVTSLLNKLVDFQQGSQEKKTSGRIPVIQSLQKLINEWMKVKNFCGLFVFMTEINSDVIYFYLNNEQFAVRWTTVKRMAWSP